MRKGTSPGFLGPDVGPRAGGAESGRALLGANGSKKTPQEQTTQTRAMHLSARDEGSFQKAPVQPPRSPQKGPTSQPASTPAAYPPSHAPHCPCARWGGGWAGVKGREKHHGGGGDMTGSLARSGVCLERDPTVGLPPWETLRRAESPRATQGTFIWEMGSVLTESGLNDRPPTPPRKSKTFRVKHPDC